MYKLNKIFYGTAFILWSIPQGVSSYNLDSAYDPDGQFSNYTISNPQMGWQANSVDTSEQQQKVLSNFSKQFPDQLSGLLPSSTDGQDPIQLYQQQNKAQGYCDSAIIQSTAIIQSATITNQYAGLVDLRVLPLTSYSSDVQQKVEDIGSTNPNVLQMSFIGNPQFNSIYSADILNGFQSYFQKVNTVNSISPVISTLPASTNDIVIPDIIIAYLNPENLSPLPDPLVISLNHLKP